MTPNIKLTVMHVPEDREACSVVSMLNADIFIALHGSGHNHRCLQVPPGV